MIIQVYSYRSLHHTASNVYDLFDAKILMWSAIPNYSSLPVGEWYPAHSNPFWSEISRNAVTKWGAVCLFTSGKWLCLLICFLRIKAIGLPVELTEKEVEVMPAHLVDTVSTGFVERSLETCTLYSSARGSHIR